MYSITKDDSSFNLMNSRYILNSLEILTKQGVGTGLRICSMMKNFSYQLQDHLLLYIYNLRTGLSCSKNHWLTSLIKKICLFQYIIQMKHLFILIYYSLSRFQQFIIKKFLWIYKHRLVLKSYNKALFIASNYLIQKWLFFLINQKETNV